MHRIVLAPSVNGSNGSNMVSATSFSRSRIPLAVENSKDGAVFSLVTATKGTKFSMLDAVTFSPFDNLGASLVGHE